MNRADRRLPHPAPVPYCRTPASVPRRGVNAQRSIRISHADTQRSSMDDRAELPPTATVKVAYSQHYTESSTNRTCKLSSVALYQSSIALLAFASVVWTAKRMAIVQAEALQEYH